MKLYAIACSKLSKPQQWVQATHAVAQYLLDNPDSKWRNGTLVMLNYDSLDHFEELLQISEIPYSKFNEPYYNNKMTAIAVTDIDWMSDVKKMQLI